MSPGPGQGERGSVSVEVAILTPLFGVLLALVVLFGRVQGARADVEGAARSAARTLALARVPEAAIATATAEASATLGEGRATCRTMTLVPRLSPTEVDVELSCVVDLADAAILPVDAAMTVTASATEVLDRFKEPG